MTEQRSKIDTSIDHRPKRRWKLGLLAERSTVASVAALARIHRKSSATIDVSLRQAQNLLREETQWLLEAPIPDAAIYALASVGYRSTNALAKDIRTGALLPYGSGSDWRLKPLTSRVYANVCAWLEAYPPIDDRERVIREYGEDISLHTAIESIAGSGQQAKRLALKMVEWIASLEPATRERLFDDAAKALTPVPAVSTRVYNDLFGRFASQRETAASAFGRLKSALKSNASWYGWEKDVRQTIDAAKDVLRRFATEMPIAVDDATPSSFEYAEMERRDAVLVELRDLVTVAEKALLKSIASSKES